MAPTRLRSPWAGGEQGACDCWRETPWHPLCRGEPEALVAERLAQITELGLMVCGSPQSCWERGKSRCSLRVWGTCRWGSTHIHTSASPQFPGKEPGPQILLCVGEPAEGAGSEPACRAELQSQPNQPEGPSRMRRNGTSSEKLHLLLPGPGAVPSWLGGLLHLTLLSLQGQPGILAAGTDPYPKVKNA